MEKTQVPLAKTWSAKKLQTNFADLKAGDWFVAVRLKDFDQHQLISAAIEKDIAGVIYQEGLLTELFDQLPMVAVPDLRSFLFHHAEVQRQSLATQVATVSGSHGKTTVKEILGTILKTEPPELSFISPDNQNTKIALATQILRLNPDCDRAVFEVGARRRGDFEIPMAFLRPSIVTLLNVGTAHVSEFGSLENLEKEKLSVLRTASAKCLVINGDDPRIVEVARLTRKNYVSFGFQSENQLRILSESANGIEISYKDHKCFIKHEGLLAGKAMNMTAAAAVALAMGLSWDQVTESLAQFRGVARRFQRLSWQGQDVIDDAFNASPESMVSGIETLLRAHAGKKILLVLGSMLELGEYSDLAHRKLAHFLAKHFDPNVMDIVTVGKEAQILNSELKTLLKNENTFSHFATALEAKPYIESLRREFDIMYFKASKSVDLKSIFSNL